MVMDDAETSLCDACRQSMGQLPDCRKKRPHRASDQPTTLINIKNQHFYLNYGKNWGNLRRKK
jgi:hypothetical protein